MSRCWTIASGIALCAFMAMPTLCLAKAPLPYVISTEALKQIIADPTLIILDTRDQKSYDRGHIPGAIRVAWEDYAGTQGTPGKGWGKVLPKKDLAAALGRIGIDATKRVVAYADPKHGWGEDGRFLWLLRLAGVVHSQVLDGGLPRWVAKGYPTSKAAAKPTATTFAIDRLDTGLMADTEWMLKNQARIKIVDARSLAEFNGAILFGETRGGHLPGAIHLHFTKVYRTDGTLKHVAALRTLFTEAGLKRTDQIAVYCTAGIRSAHLTMLLRHAGYTKARNYDESFYWWAAKEDLPLE
ncbi:MAG: rhodanese-like domain-containing protein [Myxococcota bacterium]|nr:rhodanese-like domain-containing protein [Myxococcota bacterium]